MVADFISTPLPGAPARAQEPPVSLGTVAQLLAGLNREQRRAVTHGEGPQLVLAGPGTGKTEVLTRRVAWLIATRRARPREILALTFTDNAAEEMQARVDLLVPYGQADAAIHTFHALGDRLVREYAFELGLPGDVRLITRAEAVVLLRDNLFSLGLERYLPLGNPARFLGALVDLFGRAKDEGVEPGQLAEFAAQRATSISDEADRDAAAALAEQATAYRVYQGLLASHGLIDHGDQLALARRLLRERPAVQRAVAGRYRYVLVDELQDVNRAQVDLLFALTPPGRNVTVVGDLDQAIYTFRGAAGNNLRRFADAHPDLRRTVLRRNYRSRRPIISAAARLIAHGPRAFADLLDAPPTAVRRARRPAPVRLQSFTDPAAEADAIAGQIATRIEAGQQARDFAVLARSNAEMEPLIRSLNLHGVALRTHLPVDFFAQPHVRSLVALLRFVADPSQTIELYVLATAWPYELGGAALTRLLADARRAHQPLWEQMCRVVDGPADGSAGGPFATALRRLVGDLRAQIEAAHVRSAGEVLYDHLRRSGRLAWLAAQTDPVEARAVARFFDLVRARSALLADPRATALVPHLDALIESDDQTSDVGPLDQNAVSVLTVHRAKGLEFRVVYLTGMTDGRFPATGRPPEMSVPWPEVRAEAAADDTDRLTEERRLCYVAITRARDELWLSTHVGGPGGRGTRRPSQFIVEALDLPVDKPSLVPAGPPRIAPPVSVTHAADAPAAPTTTTFSFSQLEEYLDCPERYRLRHVVGLPTPPHHAFSYGRALHAAVAWFHLQVAAGSTPSEAALADEFRRAWLPEGFLSREHEEARFSAGLRALALFRSGQVEQPAPVVAVERPFEVDLGGVRVRGRMDRLDRDEGGAVVIVDYKSSDIRLQRRADEKARDSLQLQVYAIAHRAQTGVLPREMQLHFLDSGVVGRTTPSVGRLERAQDKVVAAAAGIAAGEFAARPNAVACGYCPFRQMCPSSAA